jgi:Flp pilus assembly protein CpaB
MAASRRNRRRRSPLVTMAVLAFVLLVGGAGTVGTLAAMGQVDLSFLPFFANEEPAPVEPEAPSFEGMVPVPVSAAEIPAYTKVTREHLINRQKGDFSVVYIAEDQITDELMVDLGDIIGRVLDHKKPAGYAFTEKDFLPKGTRAGLTAGIPPDKRAYRLDASRIQGIRGLRVGDHLDIVASVPLERTTERRNPSPLDNQPATQPAKLADIRVVVNDGVIVAEVEPDEDGKAKSRSIEEIAIAVDPEEVPELMKAEALGYPLSAVARSGHADDTGASTIKVDAEPEASPPPRRLEAIIGSKRQKYVFDPSDRAPVLVD